MTQAQGPAVAILGPTASGKSALAHRVALASGGRVEILSVDAMSVYRGMDIGTAKPSLKEREEVPYHLLDLVEANEEFTVAQYQRAAQVATAEVWRRRHHALFVGGTGLYGRAVIDGLDIPGRYPDLRRDLDARAEHSLSSLYEQLRDLDPLAASRLDASNRRRVVRALEVTLGSGRPFSSYGAGLTTYSEVRVVQIALTCELNELDERIALRFAEWMNNGLLDEVDRLRNAPLGLGRTARQAVGYRELLRHLEDGEELSKCVNEAIAQSRRLARRQLSWFRRDPRIEWFSDLEHAARRVEVVLNETDPCVRD
ncbi:MAG: tRNA (adenosine(37)-N6)-dimethylallyltransferase MiaA [Acidimicrobiales bacterium]